MAGPGILRVKFFLTNSRVATASYQNGTELQLRQQLFTNVTIPTDIGPVLVKEILNYQIVNVDGGNT